MVLRSIEKAAAGTQLAHPQSLTLSLPLSRGHGGSGEGGLAAAGGGNQITEKSGLALLLALALAARAATGSWQMPAKKVALAPYTTAQYSTLPCPTPLFYHLLFVLMSQAYVPVFSVPPVCQACAPNAPKSGKGHGKMSLLPTQIGTSRLLG